MSQGSARSAKARRGLEYIAGTARSREDLEKLLKRNSHFGNSIVVEGPDGELLASVEDLEGRSHFTVSRLSVES